MSATYFRVSVTIDLKHHYFCSCAIRSSYSRGLFKVFFLFLKVAYVLVHKVVERQHLSKDAKSHLKLNGPELTEVEYCQSTLNLNRSDHNAENVANCKEEHNLEHILLFLSKRQWGVIRLNLVQLLDQHEKTNQEGCGHQSHLRKVNNGIRDWLNDVS